jgi:hypothetical protein
MAQRPHHVLQRLRPLLLHRLLRVLQVLLDLHPLVLLRRVGRALVQRPMPGVSYLLDSLVELPQPGLPHQLVQGQEHRA